MLHPSMIISRSSIARSFGREIQSRWSQTFRNQSQVATCQGKLEGKIAIVTGSTEGIGLAAAKRLATDGAKVVICSRKQDKVDQALKELKTLFPDRVEGLVCHVGKAEDRDRLIDFTMEKFGGINILVSNVAVNPYFGRILDMDVTIWDKIFDINVRAPFLLTQKVVPHMLRNNGPGDKGAIVYVSSIAAYYPMDQLGAYSISKTALLGLCKNMSVDLASERVRVNLVAPGVIKTKFSQYLWENDGIDEWYKTLTHVKRVGEPDECAGIISFLCGPDASYITGENIVVGGGIHCRL